LPPIGIGTEGSVNTTGIITAVSFSGDGSGLTNIGGLLEPLIYSPGIGATGIAATTNIVLTYQKPIAANVGIVTIQTAELSYTQAITFAGSGLYGIVGNGRDGNISGNNQAIKINIGDTIIFNNSVSGSHPLYIRVSDGGASVSTPAASGEGTATVTWTPNTAGTYYYQCSIHSAMIGTLTVQDNVSERFDVATAGIGTTVSISNATLTLNPATDLAIGSTSYYVIFPENAIQDSFGTSDSVGISSYYFETAAAAVGGGVGGTLFAWGRNSAGHLGLNDASNRSSPAQIPGTKWSMVSGGNGLNYFLNTDGELYGTGNASKLGINVSSGSFSSPIQIPGTQWDDVRSGNYCQIATKTDGTLWAWSSNGDGQLGLNDRVNRSSPTQIPGTQWDKINTVRYGVVATKTDGTLWTWGWNRGGYNTVGHRSSPTQIPGTQWSDVHAIYDTWFAIKTDGTMFGCGENGEGEMGINDQTHRSSPTQIPGTQWSTVSQVWTGRAVLATKTDGTLWTWGGANGGTSGLNTNVGNPSPRQVPGTQWSNVESGYDISMATKTDGTLWAWGYGNYGLSGLNGDAAFEVGGYRSSPIQIPGTDWSRTGIKNTFQSAFAFKTS
jgi:alpha-tubulin suppressor-like RCC1 family protein/plastocyanin